jgi:hypothetical protein
MLKPPRTGQGNLLNLAIIFAFLFIAFGCVCGGDEDNRNRRGTVVGAEEEDKPTNSKTTPANTGKKGSKKGDTKAETTRKSEAEDAGDFQVEYVDVNDTRYERVNEELRNEKVLEAAARDLNKALALPHDITLVTRDCGQINAFYNPNDRSVTICYELLDHFYTMFKKSGKSEQEATQDMFDAATFVFLHEIGHALIDAYDLPIAGREEDAADGLSTYICLEELRDGAGARATIAAAQLFGIQGQMASGKDLPFYDEHSLDQQRFYNLLCSLYGSDPNKYATIVSKGLLPEPRAVRCPSEYKQLNNTWTNLLAKYRKQ